MTAGCPRPTLEPELVRGLMACGLEVLRVGLCPTPMLYYAATTQETAGAVMVTGSHNPPDYNGFKMMLGRKPFFGAQIPQIGTMAAAGDVVAEAPGTVRDVDVAADYITRLISDWDGGDRILNVVWDNGNGAAGEVLQRLVRTLPGKHTVLNGDDRRQFPGPPPRPDGAEEPRAADRGGARAGRRSRHRVRRRRGPHRRGGRQRRHAVRRPVAGGAGARRAEEHPKGTIIADVKASQVLFDEIGRAGGTPLMWKTGHSLIKAKMAETGSPLAGEMSGHVFFADRWYGFDDALYAAVRLLGIVARMDGKLSAVREAMPQVINTPELRFDCPDTRKFGVIEEVAARLKQEGATVADIDGVRVATEDGWWLLRASNTQAVLVARCEATSEPGLERLKAALSAQLAASGLAAPDFSGGNAGH